MTFLVHVQSRFLVDGAADESQVFAWLDGLDRSTITATSFGHQQLVVEVGPEPAASGTEQAFDAAQGVLPIAGRWTPEAWPARACAESASREPTPLRRFSTDPRDVSAGGGFQQPPSASSGKGGFRPIQRLLGVLIDIRCEALAAKRSESKQERNTAFDEICSLAQAAADLVEKHAKPAPRLLEVTRVG